jgi:hypothetical protein
MTKSPWVVYEMEECVGLTDELIRVIGPFETQEAADAFAAERGLDIMELEVPDARREN